MVALQEKINDTPLYANVKWVVNKDGTHAAIEINYLTFYAHNGHYDVGYIGLFKVKIIFMPSTPFTFYFNFYLIGTVMQRSKFTRQSLGRTPYKKPQVGIEGAALAQVGAHDGDWEHISVRLSPETGALQVRPTRSSLTQTQCKSPLPHASPVPEIYACSLSSVQNLAAKGYAQEWTGKCRL